MQQTAKQPEQWRLNLYAEVDERAHKRPRGSWKTAVLFKDLVGEKHMNQSCNWFPIESGLIIHSSSWCEDYGKKFKWVPLYLDPIVS